MHHIMVSRKHKRTPVILVIDDLDIRVVDNLTLVTIGSWSIASTIF